MDVKDQSINEAVARLLTPSEPEQVKVEEPEQETLEEETLEVTEEEEDTSELEEGVEGDEDEAEDDSDVGDSDEEDDSSDAPETTSDELYTVKVDGEEYEVNLEELKKGYQLEKNYTKRVQKLSEEAKQLESLKSSLEAQSQQYAQLMELTAARQMAEVNNAKQQLAAIDKEADPVAYVRQQLRIQEIENGLRESVQQYQQTQQQKQLEQQKALQAIVAQEQSKLVEVIPEWADTNKRAEFEKAIVEYARSQGYDDSELSSIVKAKDIAVLHKARLYDELKSKQAVVNKKRKPIVKKKVKGSTPPDGRTVKARAVKEQRQRLKSSGSVNDAAAAILSLTS